MQLNGLKLAVIALAFVTMFANAEEKKELKAAVKKAPSDVLGMAVAFDESSKEFKLFEVPNVKGAGFEKLFDKKAMAAMKKEDREKLQFDALKASREIEGKAKLEEKADAKSTKVVSSAKQANAFHGRYRVGYVGRGFYGGGYGAYGYGFPVAYNGFYPQNYCYQPNYCPTYAPLYVQPVCVQPCFQQPYVQQFPSQVSYYENSQVTRSYNYSNGGYQIGGYPGQNFSYYGNPGVINGGGLVAPGAGVIGNPYRP